MNTWLAIGCRTFENNTSQFPLGLITLTGPQYSAITKPDCRYCGCYGATCFPQSHGLALQYRPSPTIDSAQHNSSYTYAVSPLLVAHSCTNALQLRMPSRFEEAQNGTQHGRRADRFTHWPRGSDNRGIFRAACLSQLSVIPHSLIQMSSDESLSEELYLVISKEERLLPYNIQYLIDSSPPGHGDDCASGRATGRYTLCANNKGCLTAKDLRTSAIYRYTATRLPIL